MPKTGRPYKVEIPAKKLLTMWIYTYIGVYPHKGEIMLEKYPTSTGRIDFQDCDPFGHLNNTKYLNYMMNARADHLRDYYELDIYEHTKETQNAWIISKNKIAYLYPVKYNEVVLYESQLLYSDKLRLMPQCIMYAEDKSSIHAILWAEFMYVDINTSKPKKHEPEIQDLLNSLVVEDEGGRKLKDLNFDSTVRQIAKEFNKVKQHEHQ